MREKSSIGAFFFALVIFNCGFFQSCRKQPDNSAAEMEARNLFTKSVETISHFSKEIEHAQDSLTVDSLETAFEKSLTEINFSFPPQTDYKLTEQENDSIFILLGNLKKTIEAKLSSLSVKEIPDSLNSEI